MSDIQALLSMEAGDELDAAIMQMRYGYTDDPPLYSGDLDVAWGLIASLPNCFQLELKRQGSRFHHGVNLHFSCVVVDHKTFKAWVGNGNTPALAVLRVWLRVVQAGVIEAAI